MPVIDLIATGARIRGLRDKNHLTNADLQRIFGFQTPQAIFKWLRGDNLPTVDNLVILADAFNVGIEDILVIRRTNNRAAA